MKLVLLYLFLFAGLVNTVHLGLYIGGASIYDIWQFRRRARMKKAAKKRSRAKKPLVSVVVPAHNEELVIERCLESIRNNTYRKVEVLVHNDCSTDRTRSILAAYQKKHPKFALRVVNRRTHAGKAGGVNFCIKKYAKGDLIMTLDADGVLHPDAIKNAVSYFDSPKVVGVAANVRLMDKHTPLGILQKFEHMIGYRSKKFYTVTNCEFIVGGVASTYRREILDQVGYYDMDIATEDIALSMKVAALGNRHHRIVYAADVVAATESVHSFRGLLKQRFRWKMGCLQVLLKHLRLIGRVNRAYSPSLTIYRLPMAILSEILLLLQPIILAYVIYLSIYYQTIGLFLGAYITITLYVLWTIWPDEHASFMRKLGMSLYAPLLYFLFYVMDAVQVVAIIRCLFKPSELSRRSPEHKGSVWVSPERMGQNAQIT